MFYRYKVNYWDTDVSEEKTDSGITFSESYYTAANNLLRAYGEEFLIDMYLCELAAEDNIMTDEEIEDAIKRKNA